MTDVKIPTAKEIRQEIFNTLKKEIGTVDAEKAMRAITVQSQYLYSQ